VGENARLPHSFRRFSPLPFSVFDRFPGQTLSPRACFVFPFWRSDCPPVFLTDLMSSAAFVPRLLCRWNLKRMLSLIILLADRPDSSRVFAPLVFFPLGDSSRLLISFAPFSFGLLMSFLWSNSFRKALGVQSCQGSAPVSFLFLQGFGYSLGKDPVRRGFLRWNVVRLDAFSSPGCTKRDTAPGEVSPPSVPSFPQPRPLWFRQNTW